MTHQTIIITVAIILSFLFGYTLRGDMIYGGMFENTVRIIGE